MVKEIYAFLKRDDRNVVAIHCNSGKGRTGTAIACLLLYSGFVDNMDDALRYYGWKRFSSGIGVSQPCQLRMIYYFEALYRQVIVAPTVKILKAIVFKTVPKISTIDEGCKPYFELTHMIDDEILLTNKNDPNLQYYAEFEEAMLIDFSHYSQEPVLHGDVQFVFKHRGVLSDSLICRVAFNTAFIPPNNTLIFKRDMVSPDKFKKDPRVSDDFLIQFIFEDFCQECNKPWSMSDLSSFCD